MASVESVASALTQFPLRAAEHNITELSGVDFVSEWLAVVQDANCSTGALSQLLQHMEMLINGSGPPDASVEGSFTVFESAFQALSHIAVLRTSPGCVNELVKHLANISEAYDLLLKCADPNEWVAPGCSGLLRLYMVEVLCALFGANRISGRHVMELTNNDTSAAVSLMAWILKCPEADFSTQELAGRTLAQLSTADSIFMPVSAVRGDGTATNDLQLAELSRVLNNHVDCLIQSVIQYEVVEAFARCICQHQQSHTRTDILIKNFFATIHNCLLYCAESQKHLRVHLALQSTIVRDIMFPYVDNILPALYEMPVVSPDTIEFHNLKSAVQTFVVCTFSIDVFRRDFLNDDIIFRLLEVPNCMQYISFLEVIIRLCVNVGMEKSPFFGLVQEKLHGGFVALPPDQQARLQLRLSRPDFSRALPTAQPTDAISDALSWALGHGRVQPLLSADQSKNPGQCFNMQPSAGGEAGTRPDASDDEEMPGLMPVNAGQPAAESGRVCALSGVLMTDPVTAPDGHTFERASLEAWFSFSHTHPLTGAPLDMSLCTTADAVRQENQAYQIGVLSAAMLAADDGGASTNTSQPSVLGELPSLPQGNVAPTSSSKPKKSKIRITSRKLIDAPDDMRCALDGKICTNPLRSPHGHVFEKKTLEKWFANCGSVCPITSKPLRMEECESDASLKKQIIKWLKETGQA
mmetsp:Transcript_45442/g.98616  ORF Transcript_45442/g.98616 Transcript_45442/m.98616 type:complete len:695 (+) Transcript_45442:56-2140(+)